MRIASANGSKNAADADADDTPQEQPAPTPVTADRSIAQTLARLWDDGMLSGDHPDEGIFTIKMEARLRYG